VGGLVPERWSSGDRANLREVFENTSGDRPCEDDVGVEIEPWKRAQRLVAGPKGCRLRRDFQLNHLDRVPAGARDGRSVVMATVAHHGHFEVGGVEALEQVVKASANDRALVVGGDQH
jgi:hypothetical protein